MRKGWMAALLIAVLAGCMPTFRAQEPERADEDEPVDSRATVPEWAKVSREEVETAVKLKLPVAKELDLGGGVKMRFVLIPPGEFMMGSRDTAAQVAARCGGFEPPAEWFADEHPQHRVKITRAFFLGAHEVTQAQYEAVRGKNPAYFTFMGAQNPVDTVSWNDAQEFCRRVSQRGGVMYRLPTETEWEYACRAGTTRPFYTGETISTDQANYHGDYWYGNGARGQSREKTLPLGSFAPNAWGLYDMHGNVWEWCADWYDWNYYEKGPAVDPEGPRSGTVRVLRGGSWFNLPFECRSARRYSKGPTLASVNGGFRVVMHVE